MTTHWQTYPTRIDWLVDRLTRTPGHLGSTDVAAVLGVSPYAGPWDLWANARAWTLLDEPTARQKAAESEASKTRDQARGNWAEAYLLDWYIDTHQPTSLEREIRTVHSDRAPWLTVSPDATCTRDGLFIVPEIKTARYADGWGADGTTVDRMPSARDLWPATQIPPYYLTQAAALLAATEADAVDFVVGLAFHDIRTIRLLRDDRYIDWMIGRCADFRERHLLGDEEPPIDGSKGCTDCLRTVQLSNEDHEADDDETAALMAYCNARAAEKVASEAKALAANQIRAGLAAAGHSRVWVRGGPSASVSVKGTLTVKD